MFIGEHHNSEHEARTIREIARALLSEIQAQGHICLKAEVIAAMAVDVRVLRESQAKVCEKIDALTIEVAQTRGEKRVIVAAVGLVASIIGAVVAKFF